MHLCNFDIIQLILFEHINGLLQTKIKQLFDVTCISLNTIKSKIEKDNNM